MTICAMVQLTLDTTHTHCALALSRQNGRRIDFLACQSRAVGRGHAEVLMEEVEKLFQKTNLVPADLTHIAVTAGPGSFTGLRTGIATAKALALALDIEAVGVGVLEALIEQARPLQKAQDSSCGIIAAILNARREEYYIQAEKRDGTVLIPPSVMSMEEVLLQCASIRPSLMITGPDVPQLPEIKARIHQAALSHAPYIMTVARLGHSRRQSSYPAQPLYLRKPDAKPQKYGFFAPQAAS